LGSLHSFNFFSFFFVMGQSHWLIAKRKKKVEIQYHVPQFVPQAKNGDKQLWNKSLMQPMRRLSMHTWRVHEGICFFVLSFSIALNMFASCSPSSQVVPPTRSR
jgi:hypothetical protein